MRAPLRVWGGSGCTPVSQPQETLAHGVSSELNSQALNSGLLVGVRAIVRCPLAHLSKHGLGPQGSVEPLCYPFT